MTRLLRTVAPLALALTLWGCPFVTLPPSARVGAAVGAASAPLAHCPANDRELAALQNARIIADYYYRYGSRPMSPDQLAAIHEARRNVDRACNIPAQ